MKNRILLCLVLGVCSATAQEKSTEKGTPKTQLESFAAETGVVIIKGYTDIGSVAGMGSVNIDCKEFTNAKSGRKSYGITVQVKEMGRLEREYRWWAARNALFLLESVDVARRYGDASLGVLHR